MKRAVPVVALSIVGLIAVWRYEPSAAPADSTAGPAPAAATPSGSSGSSSATVVKGTTVTTDKGPVQVEASFEGGRITAVRMLQQPNHPQTRAAVPKLVAQTLKAQSADVDTVTGATITSDAYRTSLQAAIDAKGA
ncbi:FMN-binding protein [Streptomyces aureus]|uniref:FMN-binding protein n=1 Tax=Streptomyces aureus TaxID=193461 RepID=UPI003409DE1F